MRDLFSGKDLFTQCMAIGRHPVMFVDGEGKTTYLDFESTTQLGYDSGTILGPSFFERAGMERLKKFLVRWVTEPELLYYMHPVPSGVVMLDLIDIVTFAARTSALPGGRGGLRLDCWHTQLRESLGFYSEVGCFGLDDRNRQPW